MKYVHCACDEGLNKDKKCVVGTEAMLNGFDSVVNVAEPSALK